MKQFVKYVGLSMLSSLGYSLYVLADTFFIANGIGSDGLTALNLALPLYNLIFGIGLLLSIGGATKYTIAYSQKKFQLANSYFNYSCYLGIILSIPFLMIGFFFAKDVAMLLGCNKELLPMVIPYLSTYMKFAPFFIFQYIITTFIKNDHAPKLVSIATLAGTLFNIVFDYIFIFPCHLGMFGAALATGISPILSLLICSLHFKKANFSLQKVKIHFQRIKEIFEIGIPSFINELSTGLVILVFNLVILRLEGNIGVASYGIISNLAIIVNGLYGGITSGNQPLLSSSFGSNDLKATNQYLNYALILSFILSSTILLITCFFKGPIISLFNSENNHQLATIASIGLPLYFSGYFASGINMIMISYFASIEKSRPSLIISILHGGLLIIPCVILLSYLFQIKGTWLSYLVSELITLLFTFILYKKGKTD